MNTRKVLEEKFSAIEDGLQNDHDMIISSHQVSSLLTAHKKKMKLRSQPHRELLVLVAAGEPNSVQLPDEFAYHDPLNVWTSTTFDLNSSKLTKAVTEVWNHNNPNFMESVAPHIILNEEMQPVKAN